VVLHKLRAHAEFGRCPRHDAHLCAMPTECRYSSALRKGCSTRQTAMRSGRRPLLVSSSAHRSPLPANSWCVCARSHSRGAR
jgi:hypothetical protein